MTRMTRKLLLVLLLPLLLLPTAGTAFVGSEADSDSFDLNRARLLSFVIRQQLVSHHYSHKPLDDQLSKDAFTLFLKQIDSQKRFLLQEDVRRLEKFETRIDDELASSQVRLPQVTAKTMEQRVADVREMVFSLLDEGFDLHREERLETDPDKIKYCETPAELRDRWRKILKLQVINRLFALEENAAAEDEDATAGDEKALLAKAVDKVRSNQEHLFNQLQEDRRQDYFDVYFNAVASAFDPHSNYLPPMTKEDFDISMRGSLEGIGATLRQEEGFIKVVRIIPGSAAYRQGQLEAEDTILAVGEGSDDAVDVVDMRLRDAVKLIRGKKGTEVRLHVRKPDGQRVIIPIVRDVVQIEETFVKSAVLPLPDRERSYGYIRIPSFYRDFEGGMNGGGRNSTDDTRKELERLREAGIEGLVLDLRNNGGGALTDAVSVAGLFIEGGPVVQVKNADGKIETLTDNDESVAYGGPLVVLVNKFSASASEILAGALQDYDRAVIIGSEHTHGKGTVQAVIDLDRSLPFPNMDKYRPLGAMKVTIQKFYRISGDSTQYRGVVPDIVLPDRLRHVESGEQYLEHSLPWDKVSSADFSTWPASPPVQKLEERSLARLAENEELTEIAREAERVRERMADTTYPLHIDQARERHQQMQIERENRPFYGMAGMHDEEASEDRDLSEKERKALWAEKTAEDPYVLEAVSILQDFRRLEEITDGLTEKATTAATP
jgi:carboxyl-terminal processing protease